MKATIEAPKGRMITLEMTEAEAKVLQRTMEYLEDDDIRRGTGNQGVSVCNVLCVALSAIL